MELDSSVHLTRKYPWQLRHLHQWSSASLAEGRQFDPGLLYFGKLMRSQKVGLNCSQRKQQPFLRQGTHDYCTAPRDQNYDFLEKFLRRSR